MGHGLGKYEGTITAWDLLDYEQVEPEPWHVGWLKTHRDEVGRPIYRYPMNKVLAHALWLDRRWQWLKQRMDR